MSRGQRSGKENFRRQISARLCMMYGLYIKEDKLVRAWRGKGLPHVPETQKGDRAGGQEQGVWGLMTRGGLRVWERKPGQR